MRLNSEKYMIVWHDSLSQLDFDWVFWKDKEEDSETRYNKREREVRRRQIRGERRGTCAYYFFFL